MDKESEESARSLNHSSQSNLALDYFFKMLNTALKMLDTKTKDRGWIRMNVVRQAPFRRRNGMVTRIDLIDVLSHNNNEIMTRLRISFNASN